LPKAKAKRTKKADKYGQLPRDLRGAAKLLDEKKLIMNINKALGKDGRVETPLPRGDDPKHVETVLGGIARKIGQLGRGSSGRTRAPSPMSVEPPLFRRAEFERQMVAGLEPRRGRSVGPRSVQHGGSSSSRPEDF
jgi:hypothetical protein